MERFRVEVISSTVEPQRVIYAAMHQDYSDFFVAERLDKIPSETKAGEIIVDKLLAGNRGHYGCYSADTEVLSSDGWIQWQDVTVEHQLLAIDIHHGKGHWEKPKNLQILDFKSQDKIALIYNSSLDLKVTLDHRMVVSEKATGRTWSDWKFIEANEVIKQPKKYRYLCGVNETTKGCLPDDLSVDSLRGNTLENLFRLAGFFVVNQVKNEAILKANNLTSVLPFELFYHDKIKYFLSLKFFFAQSLTEDNIYLLKDRWVVPWLQRNFTEANKTDKIVPSWLLRLPRYLIKCFLEGLRLGNESQIKRTYFEIKGSKPNLDILQGLAHISGKSTVLSPAMKGEQWVLRICNSPLIDFGQEIEYVADKVPYSGKVYCATVSTGALLVRRNNKPVVCGNCLEHPQITFNCGYFPHSVMQQARTHRIATFDVQSYRYTSQNVIQVAQGIKDIEEVFYLRPAGSYTDRQGAKYNYTEEWRENDLDWCLKAAKQYTQDVKEWGMSEEHARGKLPFDYRQHFVVSFNARSLLHFLDLRHKADAQLEIQMLSRLFWGHTQIWIPEIAAWYEKYRLNKARLAP